MISMQTFQDHYPVDLGLGLHICPEQCKRQIAEAEREMSAFVVAVARNWGPVVAARAAEYWIELAESVSTHLLDSRPDWRKLTIMASSRLAMDSRANIVNGHQRGGKMSNEMTDRCCPDFFEPVQLAIVRQVREMDTTLSSTPGLAKQTAGSEEPDDSRASPLGGCISDDQSPV